MTKRDLARMGQVEAAEAGATPLEAVLGYARGSDGWASLPTQRLNAFIAALPYCHPKLAQVQLNANHSFDPDTLSDAELAAIAARGSAEAVAAETDTGELGEVEHPRPSGAGPSSGSASSAADT